VRDVYQRFFAPDADDRTMVRVGRLVVVLLGLVALGLAFTSDSFFYLALFAYTLYGAGITPALLAAFFWKRANAAGAVCSIVAGVSSACLWKLLMTDEVRASLTDAGWEFVASMDAVLPATVINLVVLVVVSLLTAPPSEEQTQAV